MQQGRFWLSYYFCYYCYFHCRLLFIQYILECALFVLKVWLVCAIGTFTIDMVWIESQFTMNLRDIKCIKILGGNLGSCSRAFLVEKNGLTFLGQHAYCLNNNLGENVWSHNSFIQMARLAQGKKIKELWLQTLLRGCLCESKLQKNNKKRNSFWRAWQTWVNNPITTYLYIR